MAVPTALTVQTTKAVSRVLPVFPNVFSEQLAALLGDLPPNVIKLGMLATDDLVLLAARLLERHPIPLIVDPVLRASDGTYLLERRAWASLMDRIVARARLVTPNLDEAEALTGSRDPERAARQFLDLGAEAVLIKGGHASGAPDDLLVLRTGEASWLPGIRRGPGAVHGTGCALSSAIAARLARGEPLREAVVAAKAYVERAIAHATRSGAGASLLTLPLEPPANPEGRA